MVLIATDATRRSGPDLARRSSWRVILRNLRAPWAALHRGDVGCSTTRSELAELPELAGLDRFAENLELGDRPASAVQSRSVAAAGSGPA
jgi:hypothetical protein